MTRITMLKEARDEALSFFGAGQGVRAGYGVATTPVYLALTHGLGGCGAGSRRSRPATDVAVPVNT
jgi:hypothetical protein